MDISSLIILLVAVITSVTQLIKKLFNLPDSVDTKLIALAVGVIFGIGTWALGFFTKIDPSLTWQDIVLLIAGSIFGAQIVYDKAINLIKK